MLRQTTTISGGARRTRGRARKPAVPKLKIFRRSPPEGRTARRQSERLVATSLHAVIFDVEGTLVDAVLPTLRCWQETLDEFGLPFTTAELHQYSGLAGGDMLDRLLPSYACSEKARIMRNQSDRFRALYLPRITAFPGTKDLLEILHTSHLRVAIASNSARDEVIHYLKAAGCEDFPDTVVSGDDVKRQKPHPGLLQRALDRLKSTAGHRIAAVGDTPFDAQAAVAAGCEPFGVLTGLFSRNDLGEAGCRVVCRDLIELRQCLTRSADAQLPTQVASLEAMAR